MANETTNLKLTKPLANEFYDINVFNDNFDKIDKELFDPSVAENTSYTTENGVKEFECKNGYVDNIVIEGQTKILNAENIEVEAGTDGAKLVSVGQGDKIEVLTRNEGYNIYNGLAEDGDINSSNGTDEVNTSRKRTCYIEIFGKKLYLSQSIARLVFYDSNKSFISCLTNISECDIPVNARFVRFSTITSNIDVQNIVVGYSSNVNSKFYKQDKKQILTTLRSLPNGVKDTIEKRGNKYYKIKRCGEVVLNGSESYSIVSKTNTLRFNCKINNPKDQGNIYSDKFLFVYNDSDIEHIKQTSTDLYIYISKDKLSAQTVEGFKTWLVSNPVTVVYELATPVIEELPNFNPQTFSDKTTLLLNSGAVQGEASFEVTNSLGSELEVLKDKVSNLDDYAYQYDTERISLLNGFVETSSAREFTVTKFGKICVLNGQISNPSTFAIGTIACILPEKYRPSKLKTFTGMISNGAGIQNLIAFDLHSSGLFRIIDAENYVANRSIKISCVWGIE